MHDAVKFCFMDCSGIFFPSIFNLGLVESADEEPEDTEDSVGGPTVLFVLLFSFSVSEEG